VLAELRAPYSGRSTPVNAWWGTFDLAISLFSGVPAEPSTTGLIGRNSGDAQQIEIGWWPGDARYPRPAFFGFAYPATQGAEMAADLPLPARWEAELGEYVFDWDDVRAHRDPAAITLEFGRAVIRHAYAVCGWPTMLAASASSEQTALK
jgi:hypothetical protein